LKKLVNIIFIDLAIFTLEDLIEELSSCDYSATNVGAASGRDGWGIPTETVRWLRRNRQLVYA
jgi:hypothetical protein